MRIAIFGSRHQEGHLAYIEAIFASLARHNVWLEIEERFYHYLCEMMSTPPAVNDIIGPDAVVDATVVLSIGGDGTFLRTARRIGSKETPILGINTGHLGYLAAVSIDEIDRCLDSFFAGHCRVESRTMLEVSSSEACLDGVRSYALNEVAILKEDTSSMINVEAKLDGSRLSVYRADGLIVSTPTGSTGYNLSVGGPIVSPTSPVWIVSPIAAHSLTMRPLVVGDTSVLELTPRSRSRAYRLAIDGKSVTLPVGTTVRISRAPFVTRVVQRPDHRFSDTLRSKLLWGV